MKANLRYKIIVMLVVFNFCVVNAIGQVLDHLVLNIETAGSLSTLLGSSADNIKYLTLSGLLNGSDIRVIRSMKSLESLNLSDAKICSGGNSYYTFTGPWGSTYFFFTSDDELGQYTFSNNARLNTITLPNSLKSIGTCAFYRSIVLQSITIPNSVLSIGESAFRSCSSLRDVNLSTGLISIGFGAFSDCTNLLSLTLPQSLDTISSGAFDNCLGLKEIHSQMTAPPIIKIRGFESVKIFTNVDADKCTLYIPKGTYQTYHSATNWGDFSHIVEEETILTSNAQDIRIEVYSENNSIIVKGANIGDDISLYNLSGILLFKTKSSLDRCNINVKDGNMYLLKIGKQRYKISL